MYAEHRPAPLNLIERPPSSPSRFDLKTRTLRSQSQNRSDPPPREAMSAPPKSSLSLFEIVHRPPSRCHTRLQRENTNFQPTFKASFLREDKTQLELQAQTQPQIQSDEQKSLKTQSVVPKTYEVKRGGKVYKVVVGYVSPFTSPLQRQELHLKTDGEVDLIIQKIKKQQEKQRLSKPQVWLGLPTSPST